ncbi:MAG: NAD(P)-binding Rossmann-like domain protein [uncultured archaeon A07HB70]|nr:MAG: NAD(P)-binding Rossmann-like domain protein [uncultured archaeon A07HB70]
MTCDTCDDEQPLADESVVVVGAGLGGLSAACHLADRGAAVEVIERNSRVGGVANRIEAEGFRSTPGPRGI